ncbi:hypothetical protein pb186bvf_015607 [Paramecium bursaria]
MIQIKREYFRVGIRKQANNEIMQQKRKNLLNQVVQEYDKEILDLMESLHDNQSCLLKDRNLLLTISKLFKELKFINLSVVSLMQSIMSEYIQYQKQIIYEKTQMDELISNMIFDMLKYFFLTLRVQIVGHYLEGGQFLSQLISIMMDTRIQWICESIFKIMCFIYPEENIKINTQLNDHNMINIIISQIMQFCFKEKMQYEQFVEGGLDLIHAVLYYKQNVEEQEFLAINSAFWKINQSNIYKGNLQISLNFIKIFNQIINTKQKYTQGQLNYHYAFISSEFNEDGKYVSKYQDQSIIQWIIERMCYCKDNNELALQFKRNAHELFMQLTYANNYEYIHCLLSYGITSCLLTNINTSNQEIFNMICCTLSNIVCENQKTKNEVAKIQMFHYLYLSLENTQIKILDNAIDFIADALESQDNEYFNCLIDQEIYGTILICLDYCKTQTDCTDRLNNILQGITNIYRTQITHIQDQQLNQKEINIHRKDFILNFFREQPQLETLIQQTIENLHNPEGPQLTFDNLISLINSQECIKYDELLQNQ